MACAHGVRTPWQTAQPLRPLLRAAVLLALACAPAATSASTPRLAAAAAGAPQLQSVGHARTLLQVSPVPPAGSVPAAAAESQLGGAVTSAAAIPTPAASDPSASPQARPPPNGLLASPSPSTGGWVPVVSGWAPAPGPSLVLVLTAVLRMVAPNEAQSRLLDKTDIMLRTTKEILQPFGLLMTARNVSSNASAAPASGGPLARYDSTDTVIELYMDSVRASALAGAIGPNTVELATKTILSRMTEAGYDVEDVVLLWTRFTGFGRKALAASSSEDFASVLQLSGPQLLPFTLQKRNAVLVALHQMFFELSQPVSSANISTWGPAQLLPTAPNVAGGAPAPVVGRRLLQGGSSSNDTINILLWTGLAPAGLTTPSRVWAAVLRSPLLQQKLAAAGVPITLRFLNATVLTRTADGQQIQVLPDPPPPGAAPGALQVPDSAPVADWYPSLGAAGSPAAGGTRGSDDGHGTSTAAIVGAVLGGCGALALACVLGLLAWHWHRRRSNTPPATPESVKVSPHHPDPGAAPAAADPGSQHSPLRGHGLPPLPPSPELSVVVGPGGGPVAARAHAASAPETGGAVLMSGKYFYPAGSHHSSGGNGTDARPRYTVNNFYYIENAVFGPGGLGPLGPTAMAQAPAGMPNAAASGAEVAARQPSPRPPQASGSGTRARPRAILSERERAALGGGAGEQLAPAEVAICKLPDGRDWLLGAGNFGAVYKGLLRGVQEVAVKKLARLHDDMLLAHLQKEIGILKIVSFDRNIVQFYGACFEDAHSPMLVMEYMQGGDLRRAFQRDERDRFSWYRKGKGIAVDIAKGLHFLHSCNVIHRDLKTSNILLSAEGVAKIADVGLAKVMTADYFSWEHAAGTFSYAAPELLLGDRCTEKVDIYSFGVVLWEIVTKEMPIRGQLRDPLVPAECPAPIARLIDDCVQKNAAARPSAKDIVDRVLALDPQEKRHRSAPS